MKHEVLFCWHFITFTFFSLWWSWPGGQLCEHCGVGEQGHEEQLLQQHPHRPQHHRQPAHCLCHPRGAARRLCQGAQRYFEKSGSKTLPRCTTTSCPTLSSPTFTTQPTGSSSVPAYISSWQVRMSTSITKKWLL